jgi:hypothetical protein
MVSGMVIVSLGGNIVILACADGLEKERVNRNSWPVIRAFVFPLYSLWLVFGFHRRTPQAPVKRVLNRRGMEKKVLKRTFAVIVFP